MDRFDQLLHDLGGLLNLPLHPDKNRICCLNINNLIHLQIEDDPAKERVLIASFVNDVPPGKFRENILKEALQANTAFPSIGTLSYCERNNKLALFGYLHYTNITPDKCADYLALFIDKANAWRQALDTGILPPSAPMGKNG